MKIKWRIGLSPEWTPLTFGADSIKLTEQGQFFLSLANC